MKFQLSKKNKDNQHEEGLRDQLSDCGARLRFSQQSLRSLLDYPREFALDVKEIDSEAFKLDISDLSAALDSDKKLKKLNSIFEKHKKRISGFIRRQQIYIHDREKEFKDIIDILAKALARKCRDLIRSADIIARYGGEEFVILLPDASLKNAVTKANAMCKSIAATRYALDDVETGHTLSVTISIGVSQFQPGDTPMTIIERADKALYQAKHLGKNHVVSEKELPEETAVSDESDP